MKRLGSIPSLARCRLIEGTLSHIIYLPGYRESQEKVLPTQASSRDTGKDSPPTSMLLPTAGWDCRRPSRRPRQQARIYREFHPPISTSAILHHGTRDMGRPWIPPSSHKPHPIGRETRDANAESQNPLPPCSDTRVRTRPTMCRHESSRSDRQRVERGGQAAMNRPAPPRLACCSLRRVRRRPGFGRVGSRYVVVIYVTYEPVGLMLAWVCAVGVEGNGSGG